jgi:hypothetical protein
MFVWEGAVPKDFLQPIQALVQPWLPGARGDAPAPGPPNSGAPRPGGAATGARQLKRALARAQQTDGSAFWRSQLLNTAGALVQVRRARAPRPGWRRCGAAAPLRRAAPRAAPRLSAPRPTPGPIAPAAALGPLPPFHRALAIPFTNALPPPPPQYGGVLSAVASVMSPQGPGCCDHNGRERVANLLTSLPYAAIGIHGIRCACGGAGVGGGGLSWEGPRGKGRVSSRGWGRRGQALAPPPQGAPQEALPLQAVPPRAPLTPPPPRRPPSRPQEPAHRQGPRVGRVHARRLRRQPHVPRVPRPLALAGAQGGLLDDIHLQR